jgi:hypothetical protein
MAPRERYFKFWLKKIEKASTIAQMASSQPIATSTIMFASPLFL